MRVQKLSAKLVRSWIRVRPRDSHKGDYGHVLVLAGSRGMSGAGVLSAWGALRGGAGLVTLATPRSASLAAARKLRPEAMSLTLPQTPAGSVSLKALPRILEYIKKRGITTLVAGPGLTRSPETAALVRRLFHKLSGDRVRLLGAVFDADGFLAFHPGDLANLRLPIIVTPHPGEMAKFLGIPTTRLQSARSEAAQKFAMLNRVVCVLKGNKTVVSDGSRTFLNTTGNPGMATGGSGDVLSGLIGALMAQTASLVQAAAAGVYIHGLAGDLAARKKTEIAMIAGDIAEKIPNAFKLCLKKNS